MTHHILITFKDPKYGKYSTEGTCPPKERGEDCYGDCMDCKNRDIEQYERYKKKFPELPNKKGFWKRLFCEHLFETVNVKDIGITTNYARKYQHQAITSICVKCGEDKVKEQKIEINYI